MGAHRGECEARISICFAANPSCTGTLRGPTLTHEAEKVGHGRLITLTFLVNELPGAFVELSRHLTGLVGGTAEGDEGGGELIQFHKMKNADEPQPIRVVNEF